MSSSSSVVVCIYECIGISSKVVTTVVLKSSKFHCNTIVTPALSLLLGVRYMHYLSRVIAYLIPSIMLMMIATSAVCICNAKYLSSKSIPYSIDRNVIPNYNNYISKFFLMGTQKNTFSDTQPRMIKLM